jgi:hypothetical protein
LLRIKTVLDFRAVAAHGGSCSDEALVLHDIIRDRLQYFGNMHLTKHAPNVSRGGAFGVDKTLRGKYLRHVGHTAECLEGIVLFDVEVERPNKRHAHQVVPAALQQVSQIVDSEWFHVNAIGAVVVKYVTASLESGAKAYLHVVVEHCDLCYTSIPQASPVDARKRSVVRKFWKLAGLASHVALASS